MRAGELFRFCVGRKFTIRGFGRYGHVELRVHDDPTVKSEFGLNSIWIEPKFIELLSKTPRRVDQPRNGLGWREDFLEAEQKFAEMEQKSVGKGKRVRRKNVQFEVNDQMYFVNFVPDEGKWYVFSPTDDGVIKIPVAMDTAPFENFTVAPEEGIKRIVH